MTLRRMSVPRQLVGCSQIYVTETVMSLSGVGHGAIEARLEEDSLEIENQLRRLDCPPPVD